MRGHLKKRGNSWVTVVYLGRDPETGKKKYEWKSVKGTKKQAEKELTDSIVKKDNGSFIKSNRITVAEFLRQWLNDYAWPNLAPRTAEGYQHIINQHLIPGLGAIKLQDLKQQHLQNYYYQKLTNGRLDAKGGLSPRTVRHHHVTLHDALKTAVKWELVVRNVADAVDTPRYQRKEMKSLDQEDLSILLEAAKNSDIYSVYYPAFYLALFTGLRRSELLGLQWDDINLTFAELKVVRTRHRLRDGTMCIKSPKTASGRRTIALTPSTVTMLKEYYKYQQALFTTKGKTLEGSDYVCIDADGSPLMPDTVTQSWRKLTKIVGLQGIRFHDARHSHASLMLRQGVHPKIVSERLGHSSVMITLDTYSHVLPGLQQAAAMKFDENLQVNQSTVDVTPVPIPHS